MQLFAERERHEAHTGAYIATGSLDLHIPYVAWDREMPGSCSFDGDRLGKSELQDPLIGATEASPGSPFLDRSSLKNFK